jgi:putative ABC transport system permease protein
MSKFALRNLLSHKLRLVLTVLAIASGVGFVVGTFVFTDILNKSLTQLFDTDPADAVVLPNESDAGVGLPSRLR